MLDAIALTGLNVVTVLVTVGLGIVKRVVFPSVAVEGGSDGVESVDEGRRFVLVVSVLDIVSVRDSDDAGGVAGVSVEVDSLVLVKVTEVRILAVGDSRLSLCKFVVVSLQVVEVLVVTIRVVIGVAFDSTRGGSAGIELESQCVDSEGGGTSSCVFDV